MLNAHSVDRAYFRKERHACSLNKNGHNLAHLEQIQNEFPSFRSAKMLKKIPKEQCVSTTCNRCLK